MVEWFKDEKNQNFLKFLGGAIVAIAVALWTAYSTVFPKKIPVAPTATPAPTNNPSQIVTPSYDINPDGQATVVVGNNNTVTNNH